MIETTSRRKHRIDETRDRLTRLMSQAHIEPRQEAAELPTDQRWEDVSTDPPDPPPRDPWWRRGRTGQLLADWIPDVSVGGRRRLTIALVGGLLLVVLIGVGVTLTSRRIEHEPPPVLPVAAASVTSSTTERPIVVSVVGQVARPGLVTLSEGARVADALRETGGAVPGVDIGALNLARRLADGEQIYVGIPPPPGAEPAPAGVPAVADKVDLNSATLTDLDALPGVGPVTAQRIVDWRAEHGRFDSVNQLREIDGIGPSKFAKLRDLVVAR